MEKNAASIVKTLGIPSKQAKLAEISAVFHLALADECVNRTCSYTCSSRAVPQERIEQPRGTVQQCALHSNSRPNSANASIE